MTLAQLDVFDPNTWEQDNYEYRVYCDDYANEYAIVDQIDYQYLVQWRWKLKESKRHKNTIKQKKYLARSGHETIGPTTYHDDGTKTQARICSTIFLHTVVIERAGIVKPKTDQKIIVDHANGNELDCRRKNLRYTTISFNNKNRFGVFEHILFEEHV